MLDHERIAMQIDETNFRITRKAQAHLALLPSPEVLRELSRQVLGICRRNADSEEVILLVNKMLCHIEKPGAKAVPYRTVSRASIANPKDMWLYRARKGLITEGVSGCWAPPRPLSKPNRMNRAGEQVLYAATNPATASGEIGVLTSGNSEQYSLIVYNISNDMTLSRIGKPAFPPRLEGEMLEKWEGILKEMGRKRRREEYSSKEDIEKVKILNDFLLEVFSGPAEWYPISQHLCRYFFPLPHGFDGWLYPCVGISQEDQNVCLLDAHARSKLEILEVLTLEKKKNKEKPRFNFARRPNGNNLERISKSKTMGKVLSDEPQWGFWNEAGLDYVEEDQIQWPTQ